jgi:hypothetical protein
MRASPHHASRVVAVLVAITAALGATGCGSPKGSVSGKVNYKGSPLKGGQVTFFMANGSNVSSEITEDGSYSIDKVVAGPVKISVSTSSLRPASAAGPGQAQGGHRSYSPPAGQENPNKSESTADRAKRYVAIPEKYEDAKTSGKEYTVKSGKQEYNIDLD